MIELVKSGYLAEQSFSSRKERPADSSDSETQATEVGANSGSLTTRPKRKFFRVKAGIAEPISEEEQEKVTTRSIKVLGVKNSPTLWHGKGKVWINWPRYNLTRTSKTSAIEKIVKRDRYDTVCNMCTSKQNRAYQKLLNLASPSQVPHYYKLHCQRLDEVRVDAASWAQECRDWTMNAHRRLLSNDAHVRNSSEGVLASDTGTVVDRLKQIYRQKGDDRRYTSEIEDLIQACEKRLQADPNFVPVDWRPFTARKRWEDGKSGWIGLKEEDIVGGEIVTDAELLGEESDEESDEEEDAGLRAQYARSFTKSCDRRRRRAIR